MLPIALGPKEEKRIAMQLAYYPGCSLQQSSALYDIQTARITETLKKMAKAEHLEPLQPQIADFHDAFVQSGLRWGRVNEMEFMGSYEMKFALRKIKTREFGAIFSEMKTQGRLGMEMTRRRRMHFGFLMAKGRKEIKALQRKSKQRAIPGT